MSKKYYALPLAALIVFLSSCAAAMTPASVPELIAPAAILNDITAVRRGNLSQLTQVEGIIVPYVEELYFNNTDAVLDKVYVRIGSEVKKGDLLAELSTEKHYESIRDLKETIEYTEKRGRVENRLTALAIEKAELELVQLKNIDVAEYEIKLKQYDLDALRSGDAHNKKLQALELERLNGLLRELEDKTGGYCLYAPIDGRIMYIEDIELGGRVSVQPAFMYIADDTRLTVNYYGTGVVNSQYAASVTALIGGKEYDLRELRYSQEEYLSFYFAGERPPVRFEILNPDGGIGTDKHVLIRIMQFSRDDVLYVPLNALHAEDGTGSQYYVYVYENGAKTRRNIKIGGSTGTKAEVTDGLAEGELIYVE